MPVRFTSPGLGGQRESFLARGAWEAGVHYRRLYADKWFVGSDQNEAKAPFGQPLYLAINSVDLSITYGIGSRTSVSLTAPFSYGTHSRFYADGKRHRVSAGGIGDVNIMANRWLLDPWRYPHHNLSLGVGLKSPIGSNHEQDDFFLADGSITQRYVDQSIQLGDGAWGIMLQTQAFQRLSDRFVAYAFGAWLASLRETTDVPSPIQGQPPVVLAAPDAYTARLGLAFGVDVEQSVSLSLGGRIDGIPQGDIIGGRDLGFRRPGYTMYVDPGVAVQRSKFSIGLNLPLRIHQYFPQSLVDRQRAFTGGGDLANYLLFLSLTRRL